MNNVNEMYLCQYFENQISNKYESFWSQQRIRRMTNNFFYFKIDKLEYWITQAEPIKPNPQCPLYYIRVYHHHFLTLIIPWFSLTVLTNCLSLFADTQCPHRTDEYK